MSNYLDRFQQKSKATERGEMMIYFCEKLNQDRIKKGINPMTIQHMAYKLTGIPTKDLYYIKSCCDQWDNEGKPWGALFNTMLKSKE